MFKGIIINKKESDTNNNNYINKDTKNNIDKSNINLNKNNVSSKENYKPKQNTQNLVENSYHYNIDEEIKVALNYLLLGEVAKFNNLYNDLELLSNNSKINNIFCISNSLELFNNTNILLNNSKKDLLNNLSTFSFVNKLDVQPIVEFSSIYSKCLFCYSNYKKELIKTVVSNTENIYVAYPYKFGSLVNNHLILSSFEHYNSTASLPEKHYKHLKQYMQQIVKINKLKNYFTLFLEFSKAQSYASHVIVEAIPVKLKYIDEVKLMYKKSLQEQDTDWSEHKQLIETYLNKGNVRKYINEKFSYVHVNFDNEGGYLHVISDINRFNSLFLKEILSIPLKKNYFEIRNPKKIDNEELNKVIIEYKQKYSFVFN